MKKITIEQARETIENAYGTIYSKEDVLAILRHLQDGQPQQKTTAIAFEISDEMRDELVSQITGDVVYSIKELDCITGYDLSMSYNRVSVDSLDVDDNTIEKIVEGVFNKWVSGLSDDDCGC